MSLVLTSRKRFFALVVLLSVILAACNADGMDQARLLMQTQTAVAATQTALVVPQNTPPPATAAPQATEAASAIANSPTAASKASNPSACDSKPASDSAFWVYKDASYTRNHFVPSGYMGDVGDVAINEANQENPCSGDTSIKIVYKPAGLGGTDCGGYTPPCKFAGVYWLQPANNWGKDEIGKGKGFDLTGYTRLVFWARADRNTRIEFKTGGVVGIYGDSLIAPRGILADLTPDWQPYEIPLRDADLSYMIGGFFFATNWQENPDAITFYLDDIRFEK